MIIQDDIPFRLIITAELLAIGVVRVYFGAPRGKEPAGAAPAQRSESGWLTGALGAIVLLHFGAILAYLTDPGLLRWSAFEVGGPIRWIAMMVSCLGVAGEIWAAVSLGASYSPMLRIAEARVVVTAGPYRWIRHPLYAFWLPVAVGWGVAACNWFIIVTGTVLVFVLAVIRVPREEAMMLQGLGESYRQYMTRTGRFIPRVWTVRPR